MGLIELALMGAMYRDRRLNVVVAIGSVVALALVGRSSDSRLPYPTSSSCDR